MKCKSRSNKTPFSKIKKGCIKNYTTLSKNKKYLSLNDLNAYKISFYLSGYVWNIIINWDYFSKDTIGKQFVRAVDSISANIAEGFGRNGKNDKIKFYYYSFGF